MMRKLLIASVLLLVSLMGFAQQENRPKVVVIVKDIKTDTLYLYDENAQISFEKYYEKRVGIDVVDLGLSIKWASVNYSTQNGSAFPWVADKDFVAEDWGERFGEPWRVPTTEEFQILRDSCKWTYEDGMFYVSNWDGKHERLLLPPTADNGVGEYWTSDGKDGLGHYFQFFYVQAFDSVFVQEHDASASYNQKAIRPVYGLPVNRQKVSVGSTYAQNYRSATILISVENVEQSDIKECGIYYALNESYLPTSQKPEAPQANKKKITSLNANNTAEINLDELTSGATYYVCAYVMTAKGTTFSEPTSFTVDAMTVSFANSTAKNVGQTAATVTLNLQGYPLRYITKYGVRVTGGGLQSEEYTVEGAPNNMIADVVITGLTAKTEYTCTPFAFFRNERIEGSGSLSFTTTDPRRVNEQFPIPEQPVDMGLPSGTKWAPYNLYYKPEPDSINLNPDSIYFFGWGDPTGTKRSTGNGSDYAGGQQILNIAGTLYDIATRQWNEPEDTLNNDKWRLPTRDDFRELFAYCTVSDSLDSQKNPKGLKFTNKKDPTKTLFIPLMGGMNELTFDISLVGIQGFYWTSEADLDKRAYWLRLQKTLSDESFKLYPRGSRACIRPVYGKIISGNINPNPDPDPDPNPEPKEDHTLDIGGYDTETSEGAETAYPMEAVDMGLPSGTKWAAWNVGAMQYGDLGKYYAWGETKTKEAFSSGNYNSSVKGYYVSDLPDEANVVKALWSQGSSNWTMPSEEDFAELFEADPIESDSLHYVRVKWDVDEKHDNHFGLRVTSRITGNSIFFPAGGNKLSNVKGMDTEGWYWTTTGSALTGMRRDYAKSYSFGLDSTLPGGIYIEQRNMERFDGFMVRPVWKENSNARELTTP